MTNLVPLYSLGAFKFLSKIIGMPIFNRNLCSGIPGESSKLKNSTGLLTASSESVIVSIDLNNISLPDNDYCILKLIALTSIFFAVK
jgi:hypothetical protein